MGFVLKVECSGREGFLDITRGVETPYIFRKDSSALANKV